MHYVLSFVPEGLYERVDRWFSPLADTVLALLVIALFPLGILNLEELVIALAVFIATPQFIRFDLSHGTGLSARKPGIILVNLSLLLFTTWLTTHQTILLAGSILFGAGVFMTSKFSTQAFIVFCISFTVLTPFGLVLLFSSLVNVIIISIGNYITIGREHAKFAYDYATVRQYSNLYDGLRSVEILNSLLSVKSLSEIPGILHRTIWFRSVVEAPFILTAISGLVLARRYDLNFSALHEFQVWIVAGLVVWVATSLYHLRFLGHASRYLEHVLLPGLVITAKGFYVFPKWYRIIVIGVISIGTTVFLYRFYNEVGKKREQDDLAGIIEELNKYSPGAVITQPKHMGRELAWKTPHTVGDYLGNSIFIESDDDASSLWHRYFPETSWVTADTEWLETRFDPDWVVFKKDGESDEKLLQPPESAPIVETIQYELYEFDDCL